MTFLTVLNQSIDRMIFLDTQDLFLEFIAIKHFKESNKDEQKPLVISVEIV